MNNGILHEPCSLRHRLSLTKPHLKLTQTHKWWKSWVSLLDWHLCISDIHIYRQGTLVLTCSMFNRLTPNDPYMSRTAKLTSKLFILYIYSTNIGTEYFKDALYSPFFFSSKCSLFHNANLFGSCIIHILYTECAKIKKNNSGAKGLSTDALLHLVPVLKLNVISGVQLWFLGTRMWTENAATGSDNLK